MSYRMYLALMPAMPETSQSMLEHSILDIYSRPEMDTDENGHLPYFELIRHMQPLQSIELGSNGFAEQFLHKCTKPFFTDQTLIDCEWLTADPNSSEFVGILPADLLYKFIRTILEQKRDALKDRLKTAAENPQLFIDQIMSDTDCMAAEYDLSIRFLKPDSTGQLQLPAPVVNSDEYKLEQLIQIYNILTQPACTIGQPVQAILYGW